MGALTLTCLSLLLGQLPQDVWPTNRREFKIPVEVQAERRSEIDRLILYVSTDQGRSWQQDQVIKPGADGFIFTAPRDGEYWFRAAAVNLRGEQEPNNLYQGPPDQKVLIDTLKPVVQIASARRQGEYVIVEWAIQEALPNPGSIRLKYRATQSASALWTEAKIEPRLRGAASVRINDPSPLTLRLEVQDLAGNQSFGQINIPGSLTTASYKNRSQETMAQIPGKPDGALPVPPGGAERDLPQPPGGAGSYKIVDAGPKQELPPNPTEQHGKADTEVNQVASWDSSGKSQIPAQKLPNPPVDGSKKRQVVSNTGNRQPRPRTLPPIQYVSKTETVLAYELSEIQPGRVGSVELWMTKDDGQRWEKWMEDPTVKPFMKKGPHSRTLNLPGEGVFGLTIVVRNRAGKGKEPQPGDAPQMRIEVDSTPPVAVLYAPEPSRTDKNSLSISWEARDRNLDQQPVTLEWAEQPDGPWRTIAANLPNSGKYAWELPEGIPVWVYLRLRVRDRAGNEAVAVSNEPQLVDLSEPKGRLIGIMPPSGRE